MKIQTSKQNLLKAVQAVQNAVSAKTTLPILSNILMETTQNSVKITGTDLDIGVSCEIEARVIMQGTTTIPAKKFADIIKELADAIVTVEVKKNNVIHIECEKSFFKMMGMPKEEFPKFPEFGDADAITLSQKTLKWMLSVTGFAMSHEESRFVLNGVLIAIEKGVLELVATDGRRLALVSKTLDNVKRISKKVIIPAKTVNELVRMLGMDEGQVRIVFGERQIIFELGNIVIISRLIEGDFPNYHQAIPEKMTSQLVMNREVFLLATKRVSIFTHEESQAIKIDLLKGKMVISKNTPQIGEAREELDIDYDGETMSIGFNPEYLIDVLKHLSDETIKFELISPEKPAIIKTNDSYTYVVLPMQLV